MRNISTKVSWQARRGQPAARALQLQQQGAVQPHREHRADHRLHRRRRHDSPDHQQQHRPDQVDVGAAATICCSTPPAASCTATSMGARRTKCELGSIPTFDLVRREHTVAPPNFLHRPATRVNVLSSLDVPRRFPRSQGRISVDVPQGVRYLDGRDFSIRAIRIPPSCCATACRTRSTPTTARRRS